MPPAVLLLYYSTFSESFPSGVKKRLKYKYDQNPRPPPARPPARPSLVLARVLSGITAILRVIDDGDGRTATHCLYALFVCRRAGCHTQVHCSRYGSHYPNPKIQRAKPPARRTRTRQTDRDESLQILKARIILFPNYKAHFPKEKSTNRE